MQWRLRPPLTRPHSSLVSRLKSRCLPILYDYLTPQPSHLLTISLDSYLNNAAGRTGKPSPSSLPSTIHNPIPLPPTHHLVYFPPPTPLTSLLPDGTDTWHWPGDPYRHRLWVGGDVKFPRRRGREEVLLNGARAAMAERICDVRILPPSRESEEKRMAVEKEEEKGGKVVVSIERRMGLVDEVKGESEADLRARLWGHNLDEDGDGDEDGLLLVERRDLLFFPPSPPPPPPPPSFAASKSPQQETQQTRQAQEEAEEEVGEDEDNSHPSRSLANSTSNSFTHPLPPPPPHLLSRYSSLTTNSHAIHLDPLYTRQAYRQPALLLQGSLLLNILTRALLAHLNGGRKMKEKGGVSVRRIRYRCLRPFFVGDAGAVLCGVGRASPRRPERGGRGMEEEWTVWIEKARQLRRGGGGGGGGRGGEEDDAGPEGDMAGDEGGGKGERKGRERKGRAVVVVVVIRATVTVEYII